MFSIDRKAKKIAKISFSLTKLVLKNDLGLIKSFKKPDLHEIETNDYPKRLDSCRWLKGLLKVTILRLLCSDEAFSFLS